MTSTERDGQAASPLRSAVGSSPGWFRDAVSAPYAEGFVEVEGCPIHYLAWGDEGDPGVVLVHGSAANAHWWSHLGSILATRHRVVAVDLSGHGDSGHRTRYTFTQWAEEVLRVADEVIEGGPVVLVGHSVGGHVVAQVSIKQPDLVRGVVLCEMPIPELVRAEREPTSASFGRGLYRSSAEAAKGFRPVGPQIDVLDYVAEHVVAHSITPRKGQWGWKFHADMFGPTPLLADLPDLATLTALTCPVAVVVGEQGHPAAKGDMLLTSALHRPTSAIEIPSAGHNPMLDQPLGLVVALRSILWAWTPQPTRDTDRAARVERTSLV